MEIQEDEKVQVKPTWGLAWGLWWKMLLITIAFQVIVGVIVWFVFLGAVVAPLLGLFGAFA
jgi:hypothetical protein